jgi:hypothetical protein
VIDETRRKQDGNDNKQTGIQWLNTKLRGVGADTVTRQDSALGKAKGIFFLPGLCAKALSDRQQGRKITKYKKGDRLRESPNKYRNEARRISARYTPLYSLEGGR